jgi:hypothetical protein
MAIISTIAMKVFKTKKKDKVNLILSQNSMSKFHPILTPRLNAMYLLLLFLVTPLNDQT